MLRALSSPGLYLDEYDRPAFAREDKVYLAGFAGIISRDEFISVRSEEVFAAFFAPPPK